MGKQFIITGIGTDVGKTVASAILAQALEATYWKPIQAGDLESSDSIKIKKLCSDKISILPEAFRLSKPISPHAAAKIDGVEINIENIDLPTVKGNLIIEGAGGLMVPINNKGLLYIDLIKSWGLPTILISKHYLGSINHTLLSAEVLKNNHIKVAGIIFVGDENIPTESIILQQTKLKYIARIPLASEVTKAFIEEQAKKISLNF